jgi:hypothetical protein
MDPLKDIPPWLTLVGSLIISAISGVIWVTSALSRSRHSIRNEMQKIVSGLEEDDAHSEARTNRQIDMLRGDISRVERRLDDFTKKGHSD